MTPKMSMHIAQYTLSNKYGLIWLMGLLLVISGALFTRQSANAADVVVYKSPTCGCCGQWVEHMKENGFSVEVHDQSNLAPIKSELGVPGRFQSCHTAMVDGYVIEGHVPASDVKRLLKEKPDVTGLAAPGMPMGSPGMDGPRKDPYDVLLFKRNGVTQVYAHHNQ